MHNEEIETTACRMWHLHERLGDDINEKSCATLIDSIRIHGLKHPVLGRSINEEGLRVELVYGARRLFAAQTLGIRLKVKICELDDRAALVEMDIENRVRRDITPYERGISYRRWLNAGVFGNQGELAKAIGISEAQVSRVLKFAELPAAVVGAFESAGHIREDWAVELARRCHDPILRTQVLRRARDRTKSGNSERPRCVYAALIAEGSQKAPATEVHDEVIKDNNGRPIMRIGYRSKTVHLIIPRESLTDDKLREIAQQLGRLLKGESRPTARQLGTVAEIRPNRVRGALGAAHFDAVV